MCKLSLVTLLTLLFSVAIAQQSSTIVGARSNALGNASTCLQDQWGALANPGAIASIKQISTGFAYERSFQFAAFDRKAVVAVVPLAIGSLGAGAFRFGDDLYNEQLVSIAYANTFGLASLGAKLNYIQYKIEGFGQKGMVTASIGGIAAITPNFSIGAYIENINQPTLYEDEKVPVKMAVGIGLKPTEKTFVTAEVEKDILFKPTVKSGIEYAFHDRVVARAGFCLHPNAATFGFGVKPRKFTIDYAFAYWNALGTKHQASINYKLERR